MTARGLKHGIAAWILDEIGEETSCEMLDLTDQNVRSYLQTLSDEVLPQAENGMIVKKRLKGVLKYDMTRFTTVRSRCAYLFSTLARDTKNHSLEKFYENKKNREMRGQILVDILNQANQKTCNLKY